MGDRANIVIQEGGREIYFYTHCGGSDLPVVLQNALVRGNDRWDDEPYINRIIFCEMIQDDVMGSTGFGIDSREGDNEHPLIYVNHDEGVVQIEEHKWSFAEYVKLDLSREIPKWW